MHFLAASIPADVWRKSSLSSVNTLAEWHEVIQHDGNFGCHIVSRAVAKIQKILVVGFVIVVLGFAARIFQIFYFCGNSKIARGLLDDMREIGDIVDFLKLVEHAVLSRGGRIFQREREALHGIAQWQESALLVALAKRGKRLANHSLTAESIDGRSEGLVEINARQ